jgi:hypothetical protein
VDQARQARRRVHGGEERRDEVQGRAERAVIPKTRQDPKQKRTTRVGRVRLRPPKGMSRKEAPRQLL